MPILSELYRGLVYAGATPLSSTLVVEQTGPMQITIRAGEFTYVDGRTCHQDADTVIDLVSDPVFPCAYKVDLGFVFGQPHAWWSSRRLDPDNPAEFEEPPGWELLDHFIYEFVVPAGAVSLDGVPIVVLTVAPGFPPGTRAEQWQGERILRGQIRIAVEAERRLE
jgi:hypothetical protein